MKKAVKMIALVCLGVFLAGSFAWAYPSKATLLKDVKAILKANNSKYTKIVPTNKWDNDWSDESYKERYPNDQCYTFVAVTFAKQADGSISTQNIRVVYNRPVGSTADKWSYGDWYPYGTTTTGLKAPAESELLDNIKESIRKNPTRWFMKWYPAEAIKGIKEIKIASPSGFEQLTSTSIKVNVEWTIEVASGTSLLTKKESASLRLDKKETGWANSIAYSQITNSQVLNEVRGSADQFAGMKNLATDGFDAVYSAE